MTIKDEKYWEDLCDTTLKQMSNAAYEVAILHKKVINLLSQVNNLVKEIQKLKTEDLTS